MRIVTVNVNGIRAAARKGMGQWLEQSAPQVLLLQEVRADSEIAAGLLPGYEAHVLPCRIKGRAGVAVAVREGSGIQVAQVRDGVARPGTLEPDVDSGRWLEADLVLPGGQQLTVVSAYIHSGEVGTVKMEQKYTHLELVDERMSQLFERAASGGPQALMAGDLNVVRSEKDIKNWKPRVSWLDPMRRGLTLGGRSVVRLLITTLVGVLTIRWPPRPWRSRHKISVLAARQATPSVGQTTPRWRLATP